MTRRIRLKSNSSQHHPYSDKSPVITRCGSTRFRGQFLEAQKRLPLAGNIVISVGLRVDFFYFKSSICDPTGKIVEIQ